MKIMSQVTTYARHTDKTNICGTGSKSAITGQGIVRKLLRKLVKIISG